jgi:hypothetical protein
MFGAYLYLLLTILSWILRFFLYLCDGCADVSNVEDFEQLGEAFKNKRVWHLFTFLWLCLGFILGKIPNNNLEDIDKEQEPLSNKKKTQFTNLEMKLDLSFITRFFTSNTKKSKFSKKKESQSGIVSFFSNFFYTFGFKLLMWFFSPFLGDFFILVFFDPEPEEDGTDMDPPNNEPGAGDPNVENDSNVANDSDAGSGLDTEANDPNDPF